MVKRNPGYYENLKIFLLAAATAGAILSSVFSLSHGIYEVYSFLYILPIILVVAFYPRHGVNFTLCISLVYIGLVYYFGPLNGSLIAISTAWFAIFIAIGVVASSYANRLRDEAIKIRRVVENSQDGIFCFDRRTKRLVEINPMGARMLRYGRDELIGQDITLIWPSEGEIQAVLSCINKDGTSCRQEALLSTKDGTLRRYLVSAILTSHDLVSCSAFDVTNQRPADEEIRDTLEGLERQVRERTAHLEKINQQLRAEILQRRHFDGTVFPKVQGNEHEQGVQQ